jgi:hypothetical protein
MPDDFIKSHHGITIKYPTSDQDKNAQKIAQDFNKAKEKIRQQFIESDKSDNKATLYAAITQFKKTNE